MYINRQFFFKPVEQSQDGNDLHLEESDAEAQG